MPFPGLSGQLLPSQVCLSQPGLGRAKGQVDQMEAGGVGVEEIGSSGEDPRARPSTQVRQKSGEEDGKPEDCEEAVRWCHRRGTGQWQPQ